MVVTESSVLGSRSGLESRIIFRVQESFVGIKARGFLSEKSAFYYFRRKHFGPSRAE